MRESRRDRPEGGKSTPPLHVALIGSRGIPANYGGYETLMEELAGRLVERGLAVTVYCRSHHTSPRLREHRGAELVVLPTIRSKHLDTPVHTLLSTLHAAGRRYDAALLVNAANALFAPLLRLGGVPVALHVDGIERRRAKWGPFGRAVYAVSERLAGLLPDAVVTDAEVIREHYVRRYGVDSTMIAYGVEPVVPESRETLDALGLESRRYFLYVSRFEPENNPHRVVEAYRRVECDLPLVMVGDAPYADEFIGELKRRADPRVLFPGAIYGVGYRELLSHAFAYIHATEVGGTHPALVEAMGYGNCLVVNRTPENEEVAGDAAVYFRAELPSSLSLALRRLLERPDELEERRRRAAARAATRYDWDSVVDRYVELFRSLARTA